MDLQSAAHPGVTLNLKVNVKADITDYAKQDILNKKMSQLHNPSKTMLHNILYLQLYMIGIIYLFLIYIKKRLNTFKMLNHVIY